MPTPKELELADRIRRRTTLQDPQMGNVSPDFGPEAPVADVTSHHAAIMQAITEGIPRIAAAFAQQETPQPPKRAYSFLGRGLEPQAQAQIEKEAEDRHQADLSVYEQDMQRRNQTAMQTQEEQFRAAEAGKGRQFEAGQQEKTLMAEEKRQRSQQEFTAGENTKRDVSEEERLQEELGARKDIATIESKQRADALAEEKAYHTRALNIEQQNADTAKARAMATGTTFGEKEASRRKAAADKDFLSRMNKYMDINSTTDVPPEVANRFRREADYQAGVTGSNTILGSWDAASKTFNLNPNAYKQTPQKSTGPVISMEDFTAQTGQKPSNVLDIEAGAPEELSKGQPAVDAEGNTLTPIKKEDVERYKKTKGVDVVYHAGQAYVRTKKVAK